jgi:hypothetical protein
VKERRNKGREGRREMEASGREEGKVPQIFGKNIYDILSCF